jgi:hypothetical protein
VKGRACKLNVAEFELGKIVRVVGAVSTLVEVESITLTPPAGGLLLSVTVHVVEADGDSTTGSQTSEEIITGEIRAIVVLAELPPYVALSVAF